MNKIAKIKAKKDESIAGSIFKKGRRDLLINSGVVVIGFLCARFLASNLKKVVFIGKNTSFVMPPGALNKNEFLSKCSSCFLCHKACLTKVIVPFSSYIAPVPRLNFDKSLCDFNCNECGKICPTGAIKELSLSKKKRVKIGSPDLDGKLCVSYTSRHICGVCVEACPTGALSYEKYAHPTNGKVYYTHIPYLTNPDLCNGCGACQFNCPVRPVRAIRIMPLDVQTILTEDQQRNDKQFHSIDEIPKDTSIGFPF